jgi:hypothetical protein
MRSRLHAIFHLVGITWDFESNFTSVKLTKIFIRISLVVLFSDLKTKSIAYCIRFIFLSDYF